MNSIRTKLSTMMFLEIFIWGTWYLTVSDYLTTLGFSASEKAWALNAFALASITALFFSNQFADRYFAAEKFLAFSHLVGGVSMLCLCWVTSFWPFFVLLLIHSLFYVPTVSITNSIAFAHLKDPQKEFGPVRLWGTVGWIVASWPFVFILANWGQVPPMGDVGFVEWLSAIFRSKFDMEDLEQKQAYLNGARYIFLAGGIGSLVLAAFSLTLPHTPPKPAKTEEQRLAWLEALKFLRKPFLLVLFIATLIDAAVHQGYFVLTFSFLKDRVGIPAQWVSPAMGIGQIAEVVAMAILGLVLKRLGWRTTMILGVLGHTVRFLVFAFFPEPAPAILIILVHGICYAFFFATVYIFVDEFFPKDARASAQGLFNFLILGAGPFIGNHVWAFMENLFRTIPTGRIDPKGQEILAVDYQKLFLVPAGTGLAAALLLLLFFHPPRSGQTPS